MANILVAFAHGSAYADPVRAALGNGGQLDVVQLDAVASGGVLGHRRNSTLAEETENRDKGTQNGGYGGKISHLMEFLLGCAGHETSKLTCHALFCNTALLHIDKIALPGDPR